LISVLMSLASVLALLVGDSIWRVSREHHP